MLLRNPRVQAVQALATWPLLTSRTVRGTDSVCVDVDDQVDLSYSLESKNFNHHTVASVISFS